MNANCTCPIHAKTPDDLYNGIINAHRQSCKQYTDKCKASNAHDCIVPGYNGYVKELPIKGDQESLNKGHASE